MSKRNRKRSRQPIGKDRRISIRSQLRTEPDVHKIAKAVVALALAQAEAEAQNQTAQQAVTPGREGPDDAQSSS
ncbi:hypothetical protein [Kribbella sindirgiensis]|uniref:Uncharacterized protein n=1 Tax=Kribbella sindirgiensis TaxID=1124744 RepID=A0A4R0IZ54_9ACTN|nr:hypothetical protein [Kribbella sindirgiensis]TCC39381.1 hypothetical protein E0H50_05450 [Kribbella sindirgiensis]